MGVSKYQSPEDYRLAKIEASKRYNEKHKEMRKERGLRQRIINGRERLMELEELYLEKYGKVVEVE